MNKDVIFSTQLIEGKIIERPNRFIMLVKIGKNEIFCHCPVTSGMSDKFYKNSPCLLSINLGKTTKYKYTVEAISLDKINCSNKNWIGINQSKINNYIYYFLQNNQFTEMIDDVHSIKREIPFGRSKFDFVVNNNYVEVKMFLNNIILNSTKGLEPKGQIISDYRFIQQYKDLLILRKKGFRVIILYCYMYEAVKQKSPILSHYSKELRRLITLAILNNIEHWQVNIRITNNVVKLQKYSLITS